MAMPMVAPTMLAVSLLGHRKPTATELWALPGPKAETAIHQNQPTFEVQYADLEGVNPDEYELILLKLEPTSSNFRLVGAKQAKQDQVQVSTADWGTYSSFLEERVGVNSKKTSTGKYEIQSMVPLTPGHYGVALRPINKDKKFAGSSVAQNTGDGLIFDSVWAFEIQQKLEIRKRRMTMTRLAFSCRSVRLGCIGTVIEEGPTFSTRTSIPKRSCGQMSTV